ncbi:MAG: intermembrane phospholipid transport protein YdbH family protein [Alphaproteobacteria bacterium]
MRRRIARHLLVVAAGFLAVAAALGWGWHALPGYVAGTIEARLAAIGFAGARVAGVTIATAGARIDEVVLDPAGRNRLGPIRVGYTIGGLIEGRVDGLFVDAADVELVVKDHGLSVAGVPLAAGAGAGSGLALPVGRIAVTTARVTVQAPIGTATLGLDHVTLVPGADGMAVDGGFTLDHQGGLASVTLDGSFTAMVADTVSVGLDIAGGGIDAGFGGADGASGWFTLTTGPGQPALAGELALSSAWVAGRVAGSAVTDVHVAVHGSPGALAVVARAAGPGGAKATLDTTIDLGALNGAPVVVSLEVSDLAAAGAPLDGRLELAFDGRIAFDATGGPRLDGSLDARLADGVVPGLAEDVTANVHATVSADPAGLELVPSAPLGVEARVTLPLPEWAAPLVDGAVALSLDAPVRLARDGDGMTVSFAGRAAVDAADGRRLRVTVTDAAVALDAGFGLRRVERLGYALDLPAFEAGPVRLDGATIDGELAGRPGAWLGRIGVQARGGVDVAEPAVRADAITLTAGARFTTAGDAVHVALTDCIALEVPRLDLGPAVVTSDSRLCVLATPDDDFLRFDPDHGYALGVRVLPFVATVEPAAAGAFPRLAFTTPIVRGRIGVGPTGTLDSLTLHLGGGTFTAPDLPAQAALVEGSIARAPGGPFTFRLRGDVKHMAEAPFVVPLGLTLEGTAAPGGAVVAQGTARAGNGALALDLDARHDLGLDAGFARVRLHPLTFVPGVRTPASLFPALAGVVEDAAGTVEAVAELTWTAAGKPDGRAEVALSGVDVTAAGVAAKAINGVLAFDGLDPPSLPPGQTLAIGLLDVGVPLVNGMIDFSLSRAGVLAVARAEWHWANGVIYAEPFTADLAETSWRATLGARDLDLAAVLDIADVAGLAGTGTLAGRLPLRLGFATVAIDDGRLETTGPGTLSYAPPPGTDALGTGQAGTALLLDALRNFHYDSLAMTIDGTAGGETTVGLKLVGRNPDLYGGYPVALNVNLSGALDTLLRRGLAGYRIPDAVRDRLATFGSGAP